MDASRHLLAFGHVLYLSLEVVNFVFAVGLEVVHLLHPYSILLLEHIAGHVRSSQFIGFACLTLPRVRPLYPVAFRSLYCFIKRPAHVDVFGVFAKY